MDPKYHKLKITAKKPDTEIWLGDDSGHFVAKGVGVLEEGLLPGGYVVSFTPQFYLRTEIHLDRDLTLTEEELAHERNT